MCLSESHCIFWATEAQIVKKPFSTWCENSHFSIICLQQSSTMKKWLNESSASAWIGALYSVPSSYNLCSAWISAAPSSNKHKFCTSDVIIRKGKPHIDIKYTSGRWPTFPPEFLFNGVSLVAHIIRRLHNDEATELHKFGQKAWEQSWEIHARARSGTRKTRQTLGIYTAFLTSKFYDSITLPSWSAAPEV